uniref:DUF3226 domain-containing protein n=1 Tax=uncultured Brachyspira sp. TaxID=221953 RepID=UPI00261AE20E
YDINILSNGGKDFNQNNINIIETNLDDNNDIIIIFDADKDFNKSKYNIKKRLKKFNIKDENIFLLPNNKDTGCLETILINIAVRKEIIKCFDEYANCISSLDNIKIPIYKSKVFAYLEAIKKYNKDDIKEENRNYMDKDIWDIENIYLNELKSFLNNFFI